MQLITTQLRQGYDRPLKILTCPTHEGYETNLAKTGFQFFAMQGQNIKPWNSSFRPVPENYTLLNTQQVPKWLSVDVILSQQKFGQYQLLAPLARQLNIPLVSLEHTLPVPQWDMNIRKQLWSMQGNLNVFISNYSIGQWGFSKDDPSVNVIHHCVDTSIFNPGEPVDRDNRVLSVVNDWKNRDWCCGYYQWERVIEGLPYLVVGDNPGLSLPAKSVDDLVSKYRTNSIFLNTSHISPIPSVILEAMACGMAVVSCKTAAIPDYVTHGYDGLLAEDENEMRRYINILLENPSKARDLGQNAVKTIQEKFNLDIFVNSWQKLLRSAANTTVCR